MTKNNSLRDTHPEIFATISAESNQGINLETLTRNSKTVISWKCNLGHTWSTQVKSRILTSCPVCSNKMVSPGFNDIATTHPHLVKLFCDPEDTKKYVAGSNKKTNFICAKGHITCSQISDKIANEHSCSVCAGKTILIGYNDLATTHPDIASDLPDENDAKRYTAGSNKIMEWECKKGHKYTSSVNSRTRQNSKCPYCTGKLAIPGETDLPTTHPELFKQWHPTKNILDPTKLKAGSGKKVWWFHTDESGQTHEWEAVILSRKVGNGCPVCSNNQIKEGYNDLATTHAKLVEEWVDLKKKPTEVTKGSHYKAQWQCEKGHIWRASISNRTLHGRGCPFCSNQQIEVTTNSLTATDPEIAAQWHPTLNLTEPGESPSGSGKIIWWQCPKEPTHKWQATIKDRTRKDGLSTGCPECSNHGESIREKELADYLQQNNIKIVRRSKNIIKGELDIYLPEHKTAIEFNGLYWHSEAIGRKDKWYHYNKYKACKDKGIQLIQIWEDDWVNQKSFMKVALLHKLNQTGSTQKIGARKLRPTKITYKEVASFLKINHIQGPIQGSYYYGLTSPENEETLNEENLKAVLVVKRSGNKNSKEHWYIERYATSVPVAGGFTKLLKHAERQLKADNETITQWITFSDNCISDGGLYSNNGFTLDKELDPDYMYTRGSRRYHKFNYRLKRFREDPALTYQEGLTEAELAKLNKIYRIWDAGKVRWVKSVD